MVANFYLLLSTTNIHNIFLKTVKSSFSPLFAILRPMEQGLKVTLEEMRCIETSAYIPCNIFTMYHVKSDNEDLMFKINLKALTDILNIFGDDGNPNLKLTYRSVGSPLCLVMNHSEENITVDCELRTMNLEDFENPSLAEECNLNKIVVNASILVELLHRLDNSAEDITITFSPNFPYFTLKSKSLSGVSEVSLNKNSESVTIYQCQQHSESIYSFSNIRHIIKVMHYASKVAITTGESGLLGLQLVINSEENQMYVEYYVTSLYMADN